MPALAVGEGHVYVVVGGVDVGERHARAHVRAGLERPGGEDLVELRTGQAVAGRQMPDERRPVVRGDHRLAVGEPRPVASDRVAGLDARLGEPERVERPQRVARLDDADPVHAPVGVALDDVDVEPWRRSASVVERPPMPPPITRTFILSPSTREFSDSEYWFG